MIFYLPEKAVAWLLPMLNDTWPKILGFMAPMVGVATGFLLFYLSGVLLRRMTLPTKAISVGPNPYRANKIRVLDTDTVPKKFRVFLWKSYLDEDSQMRAEACEQRDETK